MNVVFLDYDGVVNTPQWSINALDQRWVCNFNSEFDGRVNDTQAVQWLSEFCEKYGYAIVVTSTWRRAKNYKECLFNAGLRDGIEIIGCTPLIHNGTRGKEIGEWLKVHPEVDKYLIFDDDTDMGDHIDHLVKCDCTVGFKMNEFNKAEQLHLHFI